MNYSCGKMWVLDHLKSFETDRKGLTQTLKNTKMKHTSNEIIITWALFIILFCFLVFIFEWLIHIYGLLKFWHWIVASHPQLELETGNLKTSYDAHVTMKKLGKKFSFMKNNLDHLPLLTKRRTTQCDKLLKVLLFSVTVVRRFKYFWEIFLNSSNTILKNCMKIYLTLLFDNITVSL